MNYLAHIFLSNNNPQIQIGNFIGDFVKGKRLSHFPSNISFGIFLHRKIDEYTDSHAIVQDLVRFMRPSFGRYSAIILDMYFDYLLAKSFKIYSPKKNLLFFSIKFYIHILFNYRHLPKKVKSFIFHFILSNRLQKYETTIGLHQSLEIMSIYKSPAIHPELSIEFLNKNEKVLESEFHKFMPDLISFATEQIKKYQDEQKNNKTSYYLLN